VLGARVLRVRLDPVEVALGVGALDLELGDEDGVAPAPLSATTTGRSVERKLNAV
jgi:hypothetical protein